MRSHNQYPPPRTPRVGRPPKNGVTTQDGRLQIRITSEELKMVGRMAHASGMSTSEWVRSIAILCATSATLHNMEGRS